MSPPVHLLLDYENVQPSAEEVVRMQGGHYHLWFLHGPHQTKLPADLVEALLPLGKRVSLVQVAKQGKNALDLHLAFCMGQAVEKSRAAGQSCCCIVISGDGGFDAMFGHLQRCRVAAARAPTLTDALVVADKLMKAKSPENSRTGSPESPESPEAAKIERFIERLIENFRAHPGTGPRNKKRLHNYIASFLGKDASNGEVLKIVNGLKSKGAISVDGDTVLYNLPKRRATVKAAA